MLACRILATLQLTNLALDVRIPNTRTIYSSVSDTCAFTFLSRLLMLRCSSASAFLNRGYMCNYCMQFIARNYIAPVDRTALIVCNKFHATHCMQQIACNYFRTWAGLSLSISVWLVTSYPKCRLTKSYCYYHVIPPNTVIGCNTLASWIFSNTFESLLLLHATIAARWMQ